jgi:ketosteroid isomerase-like protein
MYEPEEKTMRRLTQITAACITLFITGIAFASSSKEDADLLTVREAVWRSWFAGDIQTLEKLVPKDTIVINSGEEKWQNQAEVFRESTQFHASGGKLIRLEFPHTEIQRFGNVAVLYSKFLYEIESNGKRSVISGRATEVFVLTNGQWTNPGWHTDREP